ncbi:hypothetical protein ACFQI7_26945 [Paenibacillus allorhizosphaerae]|uniref:Abortive infection protein n=1 Tax=Paenibacillus allorhizosphaerae TaxID=2849866 RepID=A0ABM8VLW5_9BACL|nr:hypothetical protein [Paenibacillus allorhizosphaerae]CAG7649126.1 hypothetical protein PAECIP111802_04411 [Paenibacillus allorhizosphaerae]
MNRKGVNYDVGVETSGFMSRPTFDIGVVSREIAIIKNDLKCNAIRISGTDPGRLITAAEIALIQGLEVWLSPHLHDKEEEETLQYTVACAESAEALRRRYPKLVFILGCELSLFMQGILAGDTIFERVSGPDFMESIRTGAHNKPLQAFLAKASKDVRKVFRGEVTYASAPLETVDWSLFDYVGLDYYRDIRNQASYAGKLKSYAEWQKPVVITEFGCCTYQGAEQAGGRGWMIVDRTIQPRKRLNAEYVRDEALQAKELVEQLTVLDDAGVEGAFVYTFVSPVLVHDQDPLHDLDMASYGLVKSYGDGRGTRYSDMTWEPKQSFDAVSRYYAKR